MTPGLEIEKLNKKLSIYSFTKDRPVHPNWGLTLPQQAVGSFLASCGLEVRRQAGPLATNLKMNLVAWEVARPGPENQPWRQALHTLPVLPVPCPQASLPRGKQLCRAIRKGLLGQCHLLFSCFLDKFRAP